MPETGVWKIVENRLTIATGVRAYADQRVYPSVLRQNQVLPALTYQVITAPREHAMGSDPGDVHARVQVDIYDNTYLGTASGRKHVSDALGRFRGTATGVTVHDVFLDNERDGFIEELEEADGRVWRRTLDFVLHYKE